jgi:hypothetical protein
MQKIVGITSSFTRTEYLAVVKELIAKRNRRVATNIEIDKAMTRFDQFMISMGIEYFDSDDIITGRNGFFSSCYRHVQSANPVEGKDKKWRGLGGADSIILLMAERCNSDLIATNDDGFSQVSSQVKPLLIKDEYA